MFKIGYQGSQHPDKFLTCFIATGREAVFDLNPNPVEPSVCSEPASRPQGWTKCPSDDTNRFHPVLMSPCCSSMGGLPGNDCRRWPLDVWLWLICMQISNYKGAFLYASVLRRHFHRTILLLLASSLVFFIWRSSLSSPLTSAFQRAAPLSPWKPGNFVVCGAEGLAANAAPFRLMSPVFS